MEYPLAKKSTNLQGFLKTLLYQVRVLKGILEANKRKQTLHTQHTLFFYS